MRIAHVDLDERVVVVVAQQAVGLGQVALDQLRFEQQRFELGLRLDRLDVGDVRQASTQPRLAGAARAVPDGRRWVRTRWRTLTLLPT